MEKKLIAQGPKNRKSYMVTLPIVWIKQFKLDKTKKVELETIGNKIIISAKKEVPTVATVNAEDAGRHLIKIISLLYRLGVDEIELINLKDMRIIDEIIEQRLVGFEVVSQTKDRCLLKEISTSYSMNFNQIIRRIFLMLLNLAEECYNNVSTKKEPSSLESLDKGINRLTNFCQRILSKEGHKHYSKLPFYYMLCVSLEQIADEYKWLYKNIVENNIKTDAKFIKLLKRANNFLRRLYELMFSFNMSEFSKIDREIFKVQLSIFKEIHNPILVYYLKTLLRRFSSLANIVFSINYEV
ncbi:MAG: phosphate uptake regulator PhoU [Nanoarchaeota archaeon]|nr:phosphate uptake regulator PhoU [Nanoarchaeota archaeon]